MKTLTIGRVNLLRLLRDRSNIFFVFIFPLAIVLLVGAQFGGDGPSTVIGLHGPDGATTERLISEIEGSGAIDVRRFESEEALSGEVVRGGVSAGLDIPPDLEARLGAGETVEVGFISRPDTGAGSIRPIVDAAVSQATADARRAMIVADAADTDFDAALEAVSDASPSGLAVRTDTVGESLFPADVGQFSVGAAQQLVLFTFITALTGSAAIIQSRQLGVTSRMMSTPTAPNTIIVGEAFGRFGVGVFQAAYIVAATFLFFGVDWGNLWGVGAIVVVFSAVGAGGAMLLGTLFRNDQQAGGFSVMIALGMGALGGCMLPLELFSPTLRQIAHLTPHAWAIDGLSELVYNNAGLGAIGLEVAVLAGFAFVLLMVASVRLRQVVTSG